MLKKMNKKGFTLAELLIVVAIIAVLVAISIPIFTSQLEKSREAVDEANLRSAYAECAASVLTGVASSTNVTVDTTTTAGVIKATATVKIKQQKNNWEGNATPEVGGVKLGNAITAGTDVTIIVTDDGNPPTFKQGETDLKYTAPAGGGSH